jgi:2-methylcitrate dehydratase
MVSNVRPAPDQVLADIADYALNYTIKEPSTLDAARLCAIDALACALDALDFPECTKLLGPLVPGIVVPHGARVPGTRYELDPATAAFNLGSMIRWLDLNDTFTAAQGSHPSDNLGGILMFADYLSRSRGAQGVGSLVMADVLTALIKAYEIQGCLAIENDFNEIGVDHPLLTRVASAAVLTALRGGTREQVINCVSNAWVDASLAVVRHAPNTGWRKSWASAEAIFQAARFAFMSVKGEMGYPSVLTAEKYGFYDARWEGRPFKFQRPYGEYVLPHSMFKFVAAGMHSQSAIECALRLHPLVKDRLNDIKSIDIHSQKALMRIMNKTGPLHNPADRDHCVKYIVAVGLIHGKLDPQDFSDDFAADPRIDGLRAMTMVTEDMRFTREFYDPEKRSSANAVQVHFKDGSSTPKVEIEYPVGHPRRRSEVMPVLRAKFEASLARRFDDARRNKILAVCGDAAAFDSMPVDAFVGLLAAG